ncbi:glycosyltransferase family 39 protein [Mycobacterium sp. C31M]
MTDTSVHPLAWRPLAAIAAVVAGAQLTAALIGRDYWFDEVYMLAIGRSHLDWGSADQPPLVPALAALADALFPGSLIALRIPAIVATTVAVVVAAMITREMGGDRRAQIVVAAVQATGFWVAVGGHWLTPYTLEPVGWLLVIWLLVRWIRVRDDRLLLVLGAVAGVAAMTKFQVLLLCAVLIAAVLAVGPRELLRRPMLWGGAGIGALVCAPTLWWQARHGWPQLQMSHVVAAEAGPLYGGRGGIAVQLVVAAGVLGVALAGYGLVRLVRDPALRDFRFLGLTLVVLYVVFVVTAGRPYYLCGLYAPVAAIGAIALQRRREAGATRWGRAAWPGYALSAAAAIGGLVLGATLTRSDVGEQIAQRTAQTFQQLAPEQRERTVIIGESYIVAAYIDGYADRYALPPVFSTTRSYGYFPPPAAGLDTVLFVGDHGPTRLAPYFADIRELGNDDDGIGRWLLTEPREDWDTLWPKVRTLNVM